MATTNDSRMRGVAILDILNKYTDAEHGLSVAEIGELLGEEYGITSTEKTLREHLKMLHGMNQLRRKVLRVEKGGRVTWAAEPLFDSSALQLLSNGIARTQIDDDERRNIVSALQGLAGENMGRDLSYLKKLNLGQRTDDTFLSNIDELNRAIKSKCAVSCRFTQWTADGKLEPERNRKGDIIERIIDPYQMGYNNNGCLSLAYRPHGADADSPIYSVMVGRLNQVESLPKWRISHAPETNILELIERMSETSCLSGCAEVKVTVRTTDLDAVYDCFPKARVEELGEGFDGRAIYEARFEAPIKQARRWALEYCSRVEVIEPRELRDSIADRVRGLIRKYQV